jgi:hypothetical protein
VKLAPTAIVSAGGVSITVSSSVQTSVTMSGVILSL